MCMYVCVCEREKERAYEKEREIKGEEGRIYVSKLEQQVVTSFLERNCIIPQA